MDFILIPPILFKFLNEILTESNILIPNESYGIILEKKMQPMISEIYNERMQEFSTKEIIREFGKRIDDKNSIIYYTYKNQTLKEDAKYITVEGDATVILPLMIGALNERL